MLQVIYEPDGKKKNEFTRKTPKSLTGTVKIVSMNRTFVYRYYHYYYRDDSYTSVSSQLEII